MAAAAQERDPDGGRLEIIALNVAGEIVPGDDLAAILEGALRSAGIQPREGDVLAVAQKAVSKAEGRIVVLADIEPTPRAEEWARRWNLDARLVETVLRQAAEVLRMERGLTIARTRHGFVCANSGVDQSNAPPGCVILLPEDPDASARKLRRRFNDAFAVDMGVLITDSWGRPWRLGVMDAAIGAAGVEVLRDLRGRPDRGGRSMSTTLWAIGDAAAAAAGLLMGKRDGCPAVLIRGLRAPSHRQSAGDLIRSRQEDLFS